jgi:putative ABC transport system permease protein
VSSADFKPVEVLGRLPMDRSLDAVIGELDAILEPALASAQRRMFGADTRTYLERPAEWVDSGTRDALLVLLAAVGLVLLVACANVANLLLARGASRARELSLRSALGASTWRLIRALISECLVLALGACIAGVAIALVTLSILVRLRPDSVSSFSEVRLDPIVLAFAFGVAAATALLFGIAPALQLTSRNLGDALRHGASGVVRGSTGPRLRKLLVASQMAMSVVLLVSAGLLVRSIVYLQNVDVGFDTSNLFSAQLALPRGRYQEPAIRDALADQLLDRVRSMPGVAAATQAFVAPPNYVTGAGFEIRGGPPASPTPHAFNFVRPDYFSTLGVRFVDGRTFTIDELRSNTAMVINRAAAQHFWPDGGALGAEVRTGTDWGAVVGIVDNVVSGALTQTRDEPQLYFAFQAATAPTTFGTPPTILLIVRGAGDPAIAIASLRTATRELDPEIALSRMSLTETELASTIDGPRFNMALLTAFAIVAVLLSAVGVAGVIGYEVTERTHEIGIRVALGARTENLRRLVMRHGLAPAFVGVAAGVVGALAATQLAAGLLYGVAPHDPLTFAGALALLLLVAVGASWIPARRATRVDPIIALRAD